MVIAQDDWQAMFFVQGLHNAEKARISLLSNDRVFGLGGSIFDGGSQPLEEVADPFPAIAGPDVIAA